MGSTNLKTTKEIAASFQEIQEFMLLAKEENATKTYNKLKKKYLYLKALLQVAGMSLTDIDEIKE